MSLDSGLGYKRSNYYIDKDFQLKFIFNFCALVAGGALVTIGLLYFLSQYSTTVSIIKARVTVMTTSDFILPVLVQTVAVVTIITSIAAALVMVFVSHKIAGPLFRFKQTLKELAGGNFTNQVRLRKGDQLQAFAGEFNDMITIVRDKVLAADHQLAAVRKDIAGLGDLNLDESKKKQLADLKQKVSELEKSLRFFRT